MRVTGKLVSWKDKQGFGFVAPEVGGGYLFVHIRSFLNQSRRPVAHEIVTFEQSIGENGRPQAVKVAFAGEPLVGPTLVSFQIVFACTFLLAMAALAIAGKLLPWVAGLYVPASIVAFCAYWIDKVAARKHRRRTSESTLLLFGIIGGWPGTQKSSFQAAFWISVVVNCGALLYLASPSLRAYIRSLG